MSINCSRRLASAAILMLAFATAMMAQNASNSSIFGTAMDPGGKVMAGVRVTASSPALQVGSVSTVTLKDGTYNIRDLPTGTYSVKFERAGFQTFLRTGADLDSNFAMRIDAPLKPGDPKFVVTVTASASGVDSRNTGAGETVGTERMGSKLPSQNTTADIIAATPGLVNTAGQDPGALGQNARPRFNMYGIPSGNTNVTMMIDGYRIIANNPIPNIGATQQTVVKSTGNGADVAEAGISMNMIIKTGGDAFHGSASGAYSRMPQDNINQDLISRGTTVGPAVKWFEDYSGDFGGYVKKHKLWFFGAWHYAKNNSSQPGLIYADTKAGAIFPQTGRSYVGKVQYLFNKKWRMNAMGNFDRDYSAADLQNQAFAFTPFESTSVLDWKPYNRKAELQGNPVPDLTLDFQYGKSGYDIWRNNQSKCNNQQPAYDQTTAYYSGCRFSQFGDSQFNSYNWNAGGEWNPKGFLGGKHKFQFGNQNQRRNTPAIRPLDPAGDFQLTFAQSGTTPHQPLQIQFANAPTNPTTWDNTNGAFISDQWRVAKRLTLNLGVRYDRQHSYVPAQTKEAGLYGALFNAAVTVPYTEVGSWNRIAPHISMAWDLTGSGKTVLKMVYGRFNSENDIASNFNPAASSNTTYRWHDLNHDNLFQPGEVDFSPTGPDYLSTTAQTRKLNPDLKMPVTTQTTATLEREVSKGTTVRALYMFQRITHDSALVAIRPMSAYSIPLTREVPNPNGTLPAVCTTCEWGTPGSLVTLYDYTPDYAGGAWSQNQYINRPSSRNDFYHALEMSANKRVGKLILTASSTFTKHHKFLVLVPVSPNDLHNDVDRAWDWSARTNASYQLPKGFILGTTFNVVNGALGQPSYVFRAADARGGTANALKQQTSVTLLLGPTKPMEGAVPTFNTRIGKSFRLREKYTLDTAFDVMNVLNLNTVRTAAYAYGPSYNTITDFLPPRQFRIRAAIRF